MARPTAFTKLIAVGLPLGLALVSQAFGIFAPIPQREQGLTLVAELESGVRYDSNVFSTPDNEEESFVFLIAPRIKLNAAVSERTFVRAGYDLDAQFYTSRGDGDTEDALYNHVLFGEVAHTFAEGWSASVRNTLSLIDSPEATLEGLPAQADQSYDRNDFTINLNGQINEKNAFSARYRNTMFEYDEDIIADGLDRDENLFGLEYIFRASPVLDVVGEYRYLSVDYDNTVNSFGTNIDPSSDANFFLVGLDYRPSETLTVAWRIGAEDREFEGGNNTDDDDTFFYNRLTVIYKYMERSYVSGGILYNVAETSQTNLFTSEENLGFIANVQHELTPTLFATGSLYIEMVDLNTRSNLNLDDAEETSWRLGLGLAWEPNQKWQVRANYDYDSTNPDDSDNAFLNTALAAREYDRHRLSLSATYFFGILE